MSDGMYAVVERECGRLDLDVDEARAVVDMLTSERPDMAPLSAWACYFSGDSVARAQALLTKLGIRPAAE